ncbi:MAG: hypothetical protein PVJ39_20535 [Gammaproteobacteria bacterium]
MAIIEEKVEIHLEEDISVAQRALLVSKLEYERGVISAWFVEGKPSLMVRYDPEHFSHVTLLDALKEHGFHGKIIVS